MIKISLMLLPVFVIIGLAFWFLMPGKAVPLVINSQKPSTDTSSLTGLNEKLDLLQNKVDSLESSNSALLSKISDLESAKSTPAAKSVNNSQKTPVLIPINPGGNVNKTNWTNLTTGSITIDPKDYKGYKAAFLIINLSVYVGQGKAFARITNPDNGLSILDSEVSTDSYLPVRLMSKAFKLPIGSNSYTIQLRTLVEGYPAQAADSFLQITY